MVVAVLRISGVGVALGGKRVTVGGISTVEVGVVPAQPAARIMVKRIASVIFQNPVLIMVMIPGEVVLFYNDLRLKSLWNHNASPQRGINSIYRNVDFVVDEMGEQTDYTYDAVGNRLSQETFLSGQSSVTSYQYDHANRLTDVDGVTYVYDNNGNLLNDGTNTYTYDSANRLKTLSNQSSVSSYQYNGLGDRLQETVNGSTTTFTMDLNTGLTQALSDGTNTYVYGLGRIAQVNTVTEYFLSDALGSVRQMTNASGAITYTKAYDPYGMVTSTSGASSTAYGYTNEYTSQGLVYLRARMYAPGMGRFLTRDTWGGDYNRPLSLNRWMYVEGNPVNLTDPTGRFPEWCKSMNDRLQYKDCVRRVYNLTAPMYYQVMPPERQEGSPGCWSGAVAYRAPGYLVGHADAFNFGISYTRGEESVFDFGTMERGKFTFETAGLALDASVSEVGYHGIIIGFNNVERIEEKYRGPYAFGASGFSSANFLLGGSLGVGVAGFVSFDRELTGISEYFSILYRTK